MAQSINHDWPHSKRATPLVASSATQQQRCKWRELCVAVSQPLSKHSKLHNVLANASASGAPLPPLSMKPIRECKLRVRARNTESQCASSQNVRRTPTVTHAQPPPPSCPLPCRSSLTVLSHKGRHVKRLKSQPCRSTRHRFLPDAHNVDGNVAFRNFQSHTGKVEPELRVERTLGRIGRRRCLSLSGTLSFTLSWALLSQHLRH